MFDQNEVTHFQVDLEQKKKQQTTSDEQANRGKVPHITLWGRSQLLQSQNIFHIFTIHILYVWVRGWGMVTPA